MASTVVGAAVFKLRGAKMKPKILILIAEKTHPSEVAAEDSFEIINQIDPKIQTQRSRLMTQD